MSLDILNSLGGYASYKSALDATWTEEQVRELAILCGSVEACRIETTERLDMCGVLAGRHLVRVWREVGGEWYAQKTYAGFMQLVNIVHAGVKSTAQELVLSNLTEFEVDILRSARDLSGEEVSEAFRATPGTDDNNACIRLMLQGALSFVFCPYPSTPYNQYEITMAGVGALEDLKDESHDVPSVEGIRCVFCGGMKTVKG